MPCVTDEQLEVLPSPETTVWRFMSFSKLLSLLSTRTLFFAPVSQLRKDDPFEGSHTENRRAYLEKVSKDEEFARKELRIPDGEQLPEGLRNSYDPDRVKATNDRSAEMMFVNCWHMNEEESAHLWSTYAAFGEGVAVRSTIEGMRRSLQAAPRDITIAPVRYIDYRAQDMGTSPQRAAFHKRRSFASERELRLCGMASIDECLVERGGSKYWIPPHGMYVGADLGVLIQEVRVSPLSPHWVKDAVAATTSAFGLDVPVNRSAINDPAIF